MAQSYKKGRKFKTESPALLSASVSRASAASPPLCCRRKLLSVLPLAHLSVPLPVAPPLFCRRHPLFAPPPASPPLFCRRHPLSAPPPASPPLFCRRHPFPAPPLSSPPLCCCRKLLSVPPPVHLSVPLPASPPLFCRRHPFPAPPPHPRFCAAVCLPPLDSCRRTLSASRKAGEGCPR